MKALIYDRDPGRRASLAAWAGAEGLAPATAGRDADAAALAGRGGVALALVDAGGDPRAVARAVAAGSPGAYVAAVGAFAAPESLRAALADWADDYLDLPAGRVQFAALAHRARAAAAARSAAAAAASAAARRVAFEAIVGRGPSSSEPRRAFSRAATSGGPAVVAGEPGTGRTLVALALLSAACPGAEPAVVDCGADPAAAEAALLGPGGALMPGLTRGLLIESPDALPGGVALRVLAALTESKAPRVVATLGPTGPARPSGRGRRPARDLLTWLLRGERVRLAPLRERPEDVPALAAHYAEAAVGWRAPRLSPALLAALAAAPWPGNLPEFEAAVRGAAAAAIAAGAASAGPEHLASAGARADALAQRAEHAEGAAIREALGWTRGAVGLAAADLQIPERTLRRKMRAWDVRKEDFRGRR